MSHQSSPFPSCFRHSTAGDDIHSFPPTIPSSASASGNHTVNTSLYQTDLGIFSVTWAGTTFGHSLHLFLNPIDSTANDDSSPPSLSDRHSLTTLYFHLRIKPFFFWRKRGSKTLNFINQENEKARRPKVQIFWDLSIAKFGSGSGSLPEPQSGFYIAVVVDGEMTLLVGDMTKEAYSKTKAKNSERNQGLLLRREHLFGNRNYTTNARFGGKNLEISIDCRHNRLCLSVDNKRVLLIKRLKWKFRGNETIEVDGVTVQVSWDMYKWFFDKFKNGHAVFMFRFEEEEEEEDNKKEVGACSVDGDAKNGVVSLNENLERRKRRKGWLRTARSSSLSSISMSSVSNSSGRSSSGMEWAEAEETESIGPNNVFSLLVYAWRK